MTKCNKCYIEKAIYGYLKTNPLRCKKCKTDDMINLIRKMCIKCQKIQASFGLEHNKELTHCAKCKTDDMINVKNKMCVKCYKKQPVFGLERGKEATHCGTCKMDDMINVKHNMCTVCNKTIPYFGLEYGKAATHCKKCKSDNMFNVKDIMCIICNKTQPSFGLELGKPATHCSLCKWNNMINVVSKKCIKCQEKIPSFSLESGKRATHCGQCKTDDMINVINKCLSDFCDTRQNSLCDKYCKHCFVNLFPNKAISKAYKRKETEVVNRIQQEMPEINFIYDKIISGGCSKRRPDVFKDFLSHVIICEIDENQHNSYDTTCENKRIMEISQDLAHRPVIFIRFNPDSYTINNKKIPSPWKNTLRGINLDNKSDWDSRLDSLITRLKYWTNNIPDKMITEEILFFDQ